MSFPCIERWIDREKIPVHKIFISVAATAFGLRSLLPLNVPLRMPLIYCKRSEYQMKQATIELDGESYFCRKDKFIISCSGDAHECLLSSTKLFFCDGALRSNLHIFCNATRYISRKMGEVLECHYGKLKSEAASFIPVKVPLPSASVNEKSSSSSLSFAAQMHSLLLKLIGKHDVDEVKEWIPEALIMPRTTTRKARRTTARNY